MRGCLYSGASTGEGGTRTPRSLAGFRVDIRDGARAVVDDAAVLTDGRLDVEGRERLDGLDGRVLVAGFAPFLVLSYYIVRLTVVARRTADSFPFSTQLSRSVALRDEFTEDR